MRHNLPTVPIFRDTAPGGSIEQVAMRVLVAFPNWELHMLGTACVIGGYLALTARHVVEAALRLCTTATVGNRLQVIRGQLVITSAARSKLPILERRPVVDNKQRHRDPSPCLR